MSSTDHCVKFANAYIQINLQVYYIDNSSNKHIYSIIEREMFLIQKKIGEQKWCFLKKNYLRICDTELFY